MGREDFKKGIRGMISQPSQVRPLLLFVFLFLPLIVSAKCDFDWTNKTKMPTPRHYFAGGVVNDQIYAIGGYNISLGGSLSKMEEYSVRGNTWTTKADMLGERYYLTAGVVSNKIYVIGGIDKYGVVVSTVEVYDVGIDTWTTLSSTPMPTPRYDLVAGVVNNQIYAIGGINKYGVIISTVEEYSVVVSSWTPKEPMPTPRCGHAVAVVNNFIYVIGGEDSGGYLSTVEEYDPGTDSWAPKADMPTPRAGLVAVVIDDKIYAIGGNDNYGYLSTVEEYDPSGDSWTTLEKNMPTPRNNAIAGVVTFAPDKVYVIGGYNGSFLSKVEQGDLNYYPELWWTGALNYENDGLDPELGKRTTDFYYRVKYIDLDGKSTDYPRVHILRKGVDIDSSPFKMDYESGVKPPSAIGATYYYQINLGPASTGTYSYRFVSCDEHNFSAIGNATGEISKPEYVDDDNLPTLSWTGETGYESDGLHPDTGTVETKFKYKVKYKDEDGDTPESGFPKVHILRNGVGIDNSPFTMTKGTGDFATGTTYYYKTQLGPASTGIYSYCFICSNEWGFPCSGDPLQVSTGPSKVFDRPHLLWTGEQNYTNDGLEPQNGNEKTPYVYRIKYVQVDNLAPNSGYPKLYIVSKGTEAFTMSQVDSGDTIYSDGKIYTYIKTGLDRSINYEYYFKAYDGTYNLEADGEGTNNTSGPEVVRSVRAGESVTVWNGIMYPLQNKQNKSCFIATKITSKQDVSIKVYDSSGRKVRTIYKGSRLADDYTDEWNAKNDDGETVASGVYVIQCKWSGTNIFKKVVVIK